MTRKAVEKRRAVLVKREQAELEAERDRLCEVVKDCQDDRCPCHWAAWRQLQGVLFLLGETSDEPDLSRWYE